MSECGQNAAAKHSQGAQSCKRRPTCLFIVSSVQTATSRGLSKRMVRHTKCHKCVAILVLQRLPTVSKIADSNRSSADGLWGEGPSRSRARCSCNVIKARPTPTSALPLLNSSLRCCDNSNAKRGSVPVCAAFARRCWLSAVPMCFTKLKSSSSYVGC